LEDAEQWISQYRAFWEGTLHSLERYLRESDPVPSRPPQSEENRKWPPRNRNRKTRSS
jgi:hypothetical protein